MFFLSTYNKNIPAAKKNRGSSLVEVMVASSVILIIMIGLYAVHTFFVSNTLQNTRKIKATFLLEEGIEAVKSLRDQNWSKITSFNPNTNYRITFESGAWATTTAYVLIDSLYDRTFTVTAVSRNSSGDIVTSGGTNDTGTKKLTMTVAWSVNGATTTKTLSTYIADVL